MIRRTVGVASAEPGAARRVGIAAITGADSVVGDPIIAAFLRVGAARSELGIGLASQALAAGERVAGPPLKAEEAARALGVALARLKAITGVEIAAVADLVTAQPVLAILATAIGAAAERGVGLANAM